MTTNQQKIEPPCYKMLIYVGEDDYSTAILLIILGVGVKCVCTNMCTVTRVFYIILALTPTPSISNVGEDDYSITILLKLLCVPHALLLRGYSR